MTGLKIRALTKFYGSKKILDNVKLDVKKDEIVTIMGKSGVGKTTLLLCILGFVKPDKGNIWLENKEIVSLPIEQRQIAYLPQDYGLFPHLSVKENIEFGLIIRGIDKKNREKKVNELLRIIKLKPGLAERNISELSGGEKQRVALARALAIKPKIFLLDEPLAAIDSETKQIVGEQLRTTLKKQHIPAIIISHDPRDIKILKGTTYKLKDGKLNSSKSANNCKF